MLSYKSEVINVKSKGQSHILKNVLKFYFQNVTIYEQEIYPYFMSNVI